MTADDGNNNLPIFAGLPRVSLERQAKQGYSLDAQDYEFEEVGKRWGVSIPPEFIIEDDGYSGANFNRPAIRQAKQWGREGKISGVAWTHVDRFARDVEEGLRLIRTFRAEGLQVLLGNLGIVRDDAEFVWQMQQFMAMAQYIKSDILRKSVKGVQQKLRDGTPHGGGAPYGYRFVTVAEVMEDARRDGRPKPERKSANRLIRVESEIRAVLLIFDLADRGYSLMRIVAELTARAIPSPRAGTERSKHNLWNIFTVATILHRTEYVTGLWHYNKTQRVKPHPLRIRRKTDRHIENTTLKKRPQSQWTGGPQNEGILMEGGPVISQELYDRVQASIKRNTVVAVGRPSNANLFRGIGKCGKCNHALGIYNSRSRLHYLTCRYRVPGTSKLACNSCGWIRVEVLEKTIQEGIEEAFTSELPALLRKYRESIVPETDPVELERCRAEEKNLTRQMVTAAAKELETDDPTLQSFYAGRVSELKGQVKLLQRRIQSVAAEMRPFEVDNQEISRRIRLALKMTDRDKLRQFFLMVIESFTYLNGLVEMTLKVPVKAINPQHQVAAVEDLILLKTKGRVDSGKWERVA